MPYYDTIEEDVTRAKQILAEGRAALDAELSRLGVPATHPDAQAAVQLFAEAQGGTIYGKDTYAAYKLLESFVAEIEKLREPVERALRNDDRDQLDDVVLGPVTMFRLERMDTASWWMRCDMPDGEDVVFHIGLQKGRREIVIVAEVEKRGA